MESEKWPISPSAASTALEEDAEPMPAPLPEGQATLLRAQTLTRLAMEDCDARRERKERTPHVQKLREQCKVARGRIRKSVCSVSKVCEVTRSVEGILVHLEDAQNRVRHARNARTGDLAVCQQRLERLQELDLEGKNCRRALAEALQIEQEALQLQQRELSAALAELARGSEAAAELRGRLLRETGQRRAALKEGQELKAFDDGNFFAKKAKSMEESVQQLLQRAVSTIQWTDVECTKAFQKVQESLQRCSEETQLLRRAYDTQLRDVEFAISCADWTLGRRKDGEAERANVLLHELLSTQNHLKTLVQKCKKDLRSFETCKHTSVASLYAPQPAQAAQAARPNSAAKAASAAQLPRSCSPSVAASPVSAASCVAGAELRELRREERALRKALRSCAEGVERCAAWAEVLVELEQMA